jgi:hypothetical protein
MGKRRSVIISAASTSHTTNPANYKYGFLHPLHFRITLLLSFAYASFRSLHFVSSIGRIRISMGRRTAPSGRSRSSDDHNQRRLSDREYWNEQYEKVDKNYKSTGLYADSTNLTSIV